jgi:hypothetical protein
MTLVNREAPVVQSSASAKDKSFVKEFGEKLVSLRSKITGTVSEVSDHEIKVKGTDGKVVTHELYENYLVGRESYIHHTPSVKVGDRVNVGQLLATSNYSDNKGQMALGMNLKTAVMPFRSYNFEDALVISEDAAKKLEAEQLVPIRMEIARGIETNKDRFISLFPNKYFNEQLAKLDSQGVVKRGTILKTGDPVILAFQPKTLKSLEIQLGKLSRALKNAYTDISDTWGYEHDGEVVDVSNTGKLITVTVKTRRTMGQGDKLCLTPDHEVLTENGWLPYTSISPGLKVYSINPETQETALVRVEAVPTYKVAEYLYHVSTTSVDMLVTKNHKLLAERRKKARYSQEGDYELIPAEELYGKRYKLLLNSQPISGAQVTTVTIPGVKYLNGEKGVRISPERVLPAELYFALVGLFVSEGNLVNNQKSGSFGIDIHQTKPSSSKKIAELFEAHNLNYTRTAETFRIYGKGLYEHFKQFGPSFKDKALPKFIFEYDHTHLTTIFKWAMLGDGSYGKTSMHYFTSSPSLRDDMQRLALHIGLSAVVKERKDWDREVTICGKKIKGTTPAYILSIYGNKFRPEINHSHVDEQKTQIEKWEAYTGKVFCLTLAYNHTFYVRRNGKAHWTGNSNPFGAKGVVRIVSNSEMPQGEDGKPVDVLLNSMSVTSRVAPGLITTMAVGKVAQKLGKPLNVTPFTAGSSVEKTIDLLKKHGIKDTEKLFDPVSGKSIEVFTGPSYYTRLHHVAEDKISSRSAGTTYDINMQPSKAGSEEKSKRLGNLATTVALSNDAKAVLRDVAVVRSTKNDEFWTALKLGYTPPPPKVPFIFNKFVSHLEGSGVHVEQNGPKFNILPQTDKDIEKISKGEVKEPLTYKLKGGELVAEPGGLFDPTNTGIYGDNYNHIELNARIPNPISEEPIRKLLEVTKADYEKLISTGKIEDALRKIDVDGKIKELQGYIKSNRKTNRDSAVKVLSFLTMLKSKGLTPADLLISKVPIIPAQYRPIVAQGNQIMGADVNELYKDLMLVNKGIGNITKDVPIELQHQAKKELYDGVKAVYGLGEPISVRSREKHFKGLLATTLGTQGGSAKSSMFQAKVVNKPIDLVGRGVLVPDGNLQLNEAAIPQAILWNVYSPFVIRRLVRQGVPATKARDYVQNKHPLANQALQEELKDRPGIVTRDPQLSKYNFQGFYLRPNPDPKDFSIKLNPLVFKGYGADSDGDQLNVQVPASDDAKEEVKEKLLPEKNLIYHRTFAPIYTPSNEAAVGLFAASYEDKHNEPKKYKSAGDVVRDYLAGKLDVGDRIELS